MESHSKLVEAVFLTKVTTTPVLLEKPQMTSTVPKEVLVGSPDTLKVSWFAQ